MTRRKAEFGFVHDADTGDFLRPATREDMLRSLQSESGEYRDGGRRLLVRNGPKVHRVPLPPRSPVNIPAARSRRGEEKRSLRDIIHEAERDKYPFDFAIRNGSGHLQPETEMFDAELVEIMVHSYLVAALWSSSTDEGEPFDAEYDVGNFSDEATQRAIDDVGRFLNTTIDKQNVYDLLLDPMFQSEINVMRGGDSQYRGTKRVFDMAGHDLWLTANGHGAGFWDGDWGDEGDFLTEASKEVGESYIAVDDGGELFLE